MALDPTLVTAHSDPAASSLNSNLHTAYHNDHPEQSPASSTSPSIGLSQPFSSYMDSSVQDDTTITHSSSFSPNPEANGPVSGEGDNTPGSSGAVTPDVDPQILEALRSGKDRIYVLKLGETFEALIIERRQRVELSPSTSYQRLLIHRCSAYYRLTPESDPVNKGIFVLLSQDSRIPDRRISELVPAESTAQPAFQIMRRSALERRSKAQSHAGSVAGDDQELSDVEQSESGSLGGRSNMSNKKRMTIEEREAAYNEARSRIFMGFEEKGKDKDMSASSSTLSLNGSASTSAGGRSSAGDTDDAASSPATESEWSVPSGSNSRDRKEGRRGGPGSASASSTRSLRNGGSFHANGSGGSSRNSRAPSPSFSYASLHDSPMGHIYDPSQPHAPSAGYYGNHYAYPYSPPGPGPSPPFMPPYQYYAQHYNPYQPPPPMPPHSASDPNVTPTVSEPFMPPNQMNYAQHYAWPPHPQQPPLQSPPHAMQMPLSPQQPQQNAHPTGMPPPIPAHSPQYQPFMHPGPYTYPMNGYYPPPPLAPGQQGPPPHMNMQSPPPQQQLPQPQHQQSPQHQQHNQQQHHQQHQQQQPSYDIPRGNMNGNQMGHAPNGHFNQNSNGTRNGLGNGVITPHNNPRSTSRGSGPGGPPVGVNSAKNNRAQVSPPARSAWSYGPGVSMNGYTAPVIPAGSDAMGPRHLNANRRPSGNSSSRGNSRASPNDDVSSTSSSTTSSSSRRTYTSTTSSQHPLPARPDWAVGLKAQPTLAGARHHDLGSSRGISPISPPRSNGHNSPMPNESSPRQLSGSHAPSLQATDFPPLSSSGAVQEKKTPAGAWGNSRSMLSSPASLANGNAGGAVNTGSAHQSPIAKSEENSPKVGDVINPKLMRRPQAVVNGQSPQRAPGDKGKESGSVTGDTVANAITVAGQMVGLSIADENGVDAITNPDMSTSATSATSSSHSREKESTIASPSA